jgi:hypothetical protein
VRIFTDEERQPYSVGAQATRLESYIASQEGWELIRTFTDQCSGATLDRPALQAVSSVRCSSKISELSETGSVIRSVQGRYFSGRAR